MTSLDERLHRVLEGSRRRRDLAAIAEAQRVRRELADRQRRERILASTTATPAAEAAWEATRTALRRLVGETTWELWLEPLRLRGESDGALVVEGSSMVVGWVKRRYARRIGQLVRESGDHRGFHLIVEDEEGDEAL